MKNKKRLSVISAAAGVCILTTAAFANYQTANGYDVFKKAVFNLPKYENYTMNADISVSFDGAEMQTESFMQEMDAASKTSHEIRNEKNHDTTYSYESWTQDGRQYNKNSHSDTYYSYESFLEPAPWSISFSSDEKTNQKVMKFAEVLSDTVVGDLKNNFVCVDDGEETAAYEVNLSSIQIPELINAGLGALFAVQNYDYEHSDFYSNPENLSDDDKIMMSMGTDPYVDSVQCGFTVNKDNTFKDGTMNVTFIGVDKDGIQHTLAVSLNFSIDNVESTVVSRLDTNGLDINNYDEDVVITEDAEAAEVTEE